MPIAIAYWIPMLLWLIWGILYIYPSGAFIAGGTALIQFLLFLIIGWRLFGKPLQ